MYDFSQYLMDGEEILWSDRAVPGKGDKSIGGELFVIGFCVVCQIILIVSVVFGIGDGASGIDIGFIVMFLAIGLFEVICGYSIIYKKFLKHKQVADDFYCITNIRAFKYESKDDKLVYGFLERYDHVEATNCDGGYGDLVLSVVIDTGNDEEDLREFKRVMSEKDPTNMPQLLFESIKSPSSVGRIVKEQIKKIREENKNKL